MFKRLIGKSSRADRVEAAGENGPGREIMEHGWNTGGKEEKEQSIGVAALNFRVAGRLLRTAARQVN